MGIAQVIFVILMTIDVTVDACWHGQKRQDSYNVWWALIQDVAFAGLLYWGGFFG